MIKKQTWFGVLLFALVLFFVALFLFRNLEEVIHYDFPFKWPPLGISFVVVSMAYLSVFCIWIKLTESFGIEAPLLIAGKAWFLSQLGKYVPGKVALLLVRFNMYHGCSKRKITAATGIEFIAMLAATSFLVLLALSTTARYIPVHIRWVAGGGALLLTILLCSHFSIRSFNWGLKLFNRDPIEEYPASHQLLRFVGAYMFAGLLQGLGLFLVLSSFSPIEFRNYLAITGAYLAASLAGIVAVFAPSGLGVREGVLFLVLPVFMPRPAVIVGTLVIRLISTLVELMFAALVVAAEKIFLGKREEQ